MSSRHFTGKAVNLIDRISSRAAAIAIFAAFLVAGTAHAASIVALGDLPGGPFNSRAFALSEDGEVVAGRSVSALSGPLGEAFRWSRSSGMQVLEGTDPPFESQASGISTDGGIIVGNVDGGAVEFAVRWSAGGVAESLGFLSGSVFDSAAFDVSADGNIVVGRSVSDNSGPDGEAFRWTRASGMVGLGFLDGASESQALGISADGGTVRPGSPSAASLGMSGSRSRQPIWVGEG